jgi:ubiquinone/menaquinone biosynthesis C-methylase UbiE
MLKTAPGKSNIKFFNAWSRRYDDGRITSWFRYRQSLVIREMTLREDSFVLDVGCGTGWAVHEIASLVPYGRACGIDLSIGMIKKANQKVLYKRNAEFVVADVKNIPYHSDSYDIVFSTASFHHYPNQVDALLEMKRVLKAGGELLVLDCCRKISLGVRLWDFYSRAFERGHVKYYTHDEMIELFLEAGFIDVKLCHLSAKTFDRGKVFSSTMIVKGIKKY